MLDTIKMTAETPRKHLERFDCGNMAITAFLKSPMALDDSFGTTYIMWSDDVIVGYYNIGTGNISSANDFRIGGNIYINYLAIDKKFQKKTLDGSYISDLLISDCFQRAAEIRKAVGFGFIALSSTEEGMRLYKRNGFYELEDDMNISKNPGEDKCVPMYFPLDIE